MSIFDSLLGTLGTAARQLADQFIPGSSHAIDAAKSISAAFQSAKQLNGGIAPPSAQEDHDALMARVEKHAADVFDRLEGKK